MSEIKTNRIFVNSRDEILGIEGETLASLDLTGERKIFVDIKGEWYLQQETRNGFFKYRHIEMIGQNSPENKRLTKEAIRSLEQYNN